MPEASPESPPVCTRISKKKHASFIRGKRYVNARLRYRECVRGLSSERKFEQERGSFRSVTDPIDDLARRLCLYRIYERGILLGIIT